MFSTWRAEVESRFLRVIRIKRSRCPYILNLDIRVEIRCRVLATKNCICIADADDLFSPGSLDIWIFSRFGVSHFALVVWSRTSYLSYAKATTDGLLRCPLIFASEHFSQACCKLSPRSLLYELKSLNHSSITPWRIRRIRFVRGSLFELFELHSIHVWHVFDVDLF